MVQRRHLVCDVLKPGMSINEVLGILHQEGGFTLQKSKWGGGNIDLGINFMDPRGRDLYGGFDLRFIDGKYEQAYQLNPGTPALICDLTQLTESAAETPIPTP